MYGRIAELERAFIDPAGARVDAHIFRLAVFCAHAAKIRHAQAAVRLNLRNHGAERIHMGLQKKIALAGVFPAEINQYAALRGLFRREAERCERVQHPRRRFVCKAGRTVDREQFDRFPDCVLYIFLFHVLLSFSNNLICV